MAASRVKIGGAEIALLRRGAKAEVQARRGLTVNGVLKWRGSRVFVPVDETGAATDWLRLTVRCDLQTELWDLYVNERMVLHDLSRADTEDPAIAFFGHARAPVLIGRLAIQTANPLFRDVMDDGIPDEWENRYQLNSARARRYLDSDQDGLLDIDEYILGTNPRDPDTDHDGAPDGYEVKYGLDPLRPLTAAELESDEDHDGIPLAKEILLRTSPVNLPDDELEERLQWK